MAGTYSEADLQAMRAAAWDHILQANQGLEHTPTVVCWRLRVLEHLTCLVLIYTDGDGREMHHRMVL